MDNENIVRLCKAASTRGLTWDYFEDPEIGSPEMCETVPGILVTLLKDHVSDESNRYKTTALLAAFAARQSLACWFVYCEEEQPLRTIEKVISNLLSLAPLSRLRIDEVDLEACRPMENGKPIIDCRSSDTLAASKAVAHATRYVTYRSEKDAAFAISDAFTAFDVSPVGLIHNFEKWLFDVALPGALERRELTSDEQALFADFR